MLRKIAILSACSVLTATAASGQFVDNGREAGSADTSAFGQASEFSNVTTTFDGIELQVLRLIREPSDAGKFRLVGQFVSSNSDSRWILMYAKGPRLVDDLGNEYWITSWSGIDACREDEKEDFKWWRDLADCAGTPSRTRASNNDGRSTLVAQDVPANFSMLFAPIDDPAQGVFDPDLSKLATSVTASFSFVVALKNFDDLEKEVNEGMTTYQVVVPSIPVPQP